MITVLQSTLSLTLIPISCAPILLSPVFSIHVWEPTVGNSNTIFDQQLVESVDVNKTHDTKGQLHLLKKPHIYLDQQTILFKSQLHFKTQRA